MKEREKVKSNGEISDNVDENNEKKEMNERI